MCSSYHLCSLLKAAENTAAIGAHQRGGIPHRRECNLARICCIRDSEQMTDLKSVIVMLSDFQSVSGHHYL